MRSGGSWGPIRRAIRCRPSCSKRRNPERLLSRYPPACAASSDNFARPARSSASGWKPPSTVWRIAARLPIDELGDLFGIELEDDDVDTAGGLLTKELGRLPVSGEQVSVSGLLLTADRVEGKRRHLVTVLAERTAALQDAEDALDDTTPTTTGTTNA